MAPKVYIETTIVSYLTANPSADVIKAAHQKVTKEWWNKQRRHFDLFASEFVTVEAAAGDQIMAKRRLKILNEIQLIAVQSVAIELGRTLVKRGPLPAKAEIDAFHIAVAATSGMNYLLTWNCKHIANAQMQDGIGKICKALGFEPPRICTPEELMGE